MGSMITASVLGVAINLTLPFLLVVEQYATYSLILGFGQLLSSLAFEWARIGVLRYAYAVDEGRSQLRRSVLGMGYLFAFGLLLVSAMVLFAMVYMVSWLSAPAVTCLYAAFQGAFEGQQALARARCDDGIFSARVTTRAFLGFGFALTCGVLFRTGEAIVIGLALAYPAAAVIGKRSVGPIMLPTSFRLDEFFFLFRFGILAAASTSISLAVPTIVRSAVAASLGLSGAGGYLLAVDLTQRAFATIGSAINVVVFQRAVHVVETASVKVVRSGLRYQILTVASVVLPAAVLLVATADWLAVVLVPPLYRESFATGCIYAAAAFGIMTIRQYSLDPIFLLFGTAGRMAAGPTATVTALMVESALPATVYGVHLGGVGVQLVLAALVGLSVTLALLAHLNRISWPISDLLRLLAASAAMCVVAMLFTTVADHILVISKVLVLVAVFIGIVLALNLLGVRTAISQWYRGMRA